jgi:hypothetical protein
LICLETDARKWPLRASKCRTRAAQLLGRSKPIANGPEGLLAWIAGIGVRPSTALLDKARRVAQRVLAGDSELAELWDESESATDWRASVAALQAAIATP